MYIDYNNIIKFYLCNLKFMIFEIKFEFKYTSQ